MKKVLIIPMLLLLLLLSSCTYFEINLDAYIEIVSTYDPNDYYGFSLDISQYDMSNDVLANQSIVKQFISNDAQKVYQTIYEDRRLNEISINNFEPWSVSTSESYYTNQQIYQKNEQDNWYSSSYLQDYVLSLCPVIAIDKSYFAHIDIDSSGDTRILKGTVNDDTFYDMTGLNLTNISNITVKLRFDIVKNTFVSAEIRYEQALSYTIITFITYDEPSILVLPIN